MPIQKIPLDKYLDMKQVNKLMNKQFNPEEIIDGCKKIKNFPLEKLNKNIKKLNLSNCQQYIKKIRKIYKLNSFEFV